jgi:hypothetical protein
MIPALRIFLDQAIQVTAAEREFSEGTRRKGQNKMNKIRRTLPTRLEQHAPANV